MSELLSEYLPILIFLGVALVLSALFVAAAMIVARQNPDSAKVSAYECGFEAFGHTRGQFDVRFYLVAILFIVFDLEIAFLFPWVVAFSDVGWFGFAAVMIFLLILLVGYLYELKKGALEWD